MVSRILFADTSARYGFDCSKTEPSLFLHVDSFAARRHDKVETLNLAGLGRARGDKFDHRKLLGGERARREPEQAHRQRRDRQMPPHSCRQLVRTVILATWGDVAVARTRGLGATPGAASSGTTRTSRGTLASGAAAATGRFSGSGTVNVVGPWT